MSAEQFANNAATTLASQVLAADTTINVSSSAGFPTSPQFRVRVDNEIMLVTSLGTGTNWSVTRGSGLPVDGSTPASHSAGAAVTEVLTAGAMTNLSSYARATTNYLVNGGFDFAQRQAAVTLTPISSGAYGPDRWRCEQQAGVWQYARATGGFTTSKNAGKWLLNSGGPSKFMFYQILTNADTVPLANRSSLVAQLKLSVGSGTVGIRVGFLAWSGTADSPSNPVVSGWGAPGSNPATTTNWTLVSSGVQAVTTTPTVFTYAWTPSGTVNNLAVVIFTDAQMANGTYLYVGEAGLYDGTDQRDWLPRLQAEELRLCQSYFEKSYNTDTAPKSAESTQSAQMVPSNTILNGIIYGSQAFKVTKRAAPTVNIYSFTSGTPNTISTFGGTDLAAGSGTPVVSVANEFIFYNNSGGSVTATNNLIFYHWTADAEF